MQGTLHAYRQTCQYPAVASLHVYFEVLTLRLNLSLKGMINMDSGKEYDCNDHD
jgi:hypothetical protein